ncbi:MAG: GntR family transcriptional regulator [Frankia sp.]
MPPADPAVSRKPSPQALCGIIRDQVISGVFVPGQRLTEEVLAEQHGVSRIPIREALRLLEAEGFVRVQPYYGTFVAELSAGEAADLLEIRGVLEPLAASRAADRRTPEMVEALEDVLARGRAAVAAGRLRDLPGLNTAFHGLLARASGNTSLDQLIDQLRHKIAWVYAVELTRRAGDSWVEHQQILTAVVRGDADSARALMVAHVRGAEAAYRLRAEPATAPSSDR